MKIVSARLFPIRMPLRRQIANAKHVLNDREGVVVRLESDDGREGWGEASPFPGFGLESVEDARLALEATSKELLGRSLESLSMHELAVSEGCPTASGAIECAVLDLEAQQRDVPLRQLLCDESSRPVDILECNALITANDLDELEREARTAWFEGFRTFKLKVGALDPHQDGERVARLRETLGSAASIRLDANQAYDPKTALRAIDHFAKHEIEYFEQPLAADALDAARDLRSRSSIRLAADESATTKEATRRVIEAGAADVIIIKPSALGGLRASLDTARMARGEGLEISVTSLLDGSVAIAAAIQVAAVLAGEAPLPACGLATSGLFVREIGALPPPIDGHLHLTLLPGLGAEVDRAALSASLFAHAIDVTP